jgi:hypothetical protein
LAAVDFTAEPGVVFPQLIDAGGSVAQASLSSLGVSTAFASDPYPSESFVLAPGLIAGLTSGATSAVIPPYPLIASSNFPAIPEKVVQADRWSSTPGAAPRIPAARRAMASIPAPPR